MAEPSESVSFRLSCAMVEQLDRARGAASRGEFARRLVAAGLDGDRPAARQDELAELREEAERVRATLLEARQSWDNKLSEVLAEVEELRVDLATTVTTLLVMVTAGEKIPKRDAESWVCKNLLYARKPE